ncbi:hypothetical protein CRUP_004843 [Coryphaenoides rupestris]|nr:hypothetical protein CRUP_004843 [Coryphaenoides rupestris]
MDEDSFTIRHVTTGQCLVATGTARVGLGPCPPTPGPAQVWKWGSGQRLFHVPTALCLGLDLHSKQPGLFPCGPQGLEGVLRWHCLQGALLTAYQMGLAVSGSEVVAQRDASDVWTADQTPGGVCQRTYREEGCKNLFWDAGSGLCYQFVSSVAS